MKTTFTSVSVMLVLGITFWLMSGESTIYVVAFSPLVAIRRSKQA